MSGTFSRRARYLTFAGLATIGLAAVSQLAVTTNALSLDVTPEVAMTDSDCATRPPTVPVGYTCTVLDEPSGSNTALNGETWYLRVGDTLHIVSFALSEITQAQVCVRDTAPYDPVNVKDDK